MAWSMSQNHSYSADLLRAFINTGGIRLPLSHTRALEVIAHLEGAANWNVIALRDNAALLKSRAKTLRDYVNANLCESTLSAEAAKFCVGRIMSVPAATAEQGATENEGATEKFVWPKSGESVERIIAGLSFRLTENIVEMRLVRFLRLAGGAAILAPIGIKPTKKALTTWMSDCQAAVPALMKIGLFPVLGDPSAIDNHAPLPYAKLSKAPREIAQRLMADYAAYCGSVRSNLAGTLGAFANTIERLPKAAARDHMATFLHEFNNPDEFRQYGRDINFVISAENRAVAGRIARLAAGLGLEEDAAPLAEFERETDLVKEVREKLASFSAPAP